MSLYIGLMSGTSIDAVDAALVDFSTTYPKLIATHSIAFPEALQKQLLALTHPSNNELNLMGEASTHVGEIFAEAANELLKSAETTAEKISAIGSHGQTIRHYPNESKPFTIQIGDPNIIATHSGITTVADFRRKDIANGGQGAPLTPAFHQLLVPYDLKNENVVFLNIGGIANITVIKPMEKSIFGFDTGPGNTLLDAWTRKNLHLQTDYKGAWATSGSPHIKLLNLLLSDPYFQSPVPKSTGQELFNLKWLEKHLAAIDDQITTEDVQATLVECTAKSIANEIKNHVSPCSVFVCGGGTYNDYLMKRLKNELHEYAIDSTKKIHIDPEWIEAMAFAWFAKQTINQQPINLCSITGAKKPAILGGIYYP